MTPLGDLIARRIAADGPITVADYMTECLLHPEHGYYTTRDPLGAAGDFTTAPEISQIFGELIGLALAQAWIEQGRPAPFALAELGPGRGTLMADMLRATRAVPGFHDALRVHLVEASPALRARQAVALSGHDPVWHDSVEGLDEMPLFLVANEFFDALPVRQFLRANDAWRERVIGLQDGALAFGLAAPAPFGALADRLSDTAEGDLVELRTTADPVMAALGARIGAHGGAALIVDYGDWGSRGDTLQAVRGHDHVDPLAEPGAADLTAHVDFRALARAAGVPVVGPVHQGVLLERLGATARARSLARGLAGDALESHVAAHRRLTHPAEMGTLFKVIALHPPDTPLPPGFAP